MTCRYKNYKYYPLHIKELSHFPQFKKAEKQQSKIHYHQYCKKTVAILLTSSYNNRTN